MRQSSSPLHCFRPAPDLLPRPALRRWPPRFYCARLSYPFPVRRPIRCHSCQQHKHAHLQPSAPVLLTVLRFHHRYCDSRGCANELAYRRIQVQQPVKAISTANTDTTDRIIDLDRLRPLRFHTWQSETPDLVPVLASDRGPLYRTWLPVPVCFAPLPGRLRVPYTDSDRRPGP